MDSPATPFSQTIPGVAPLSMGRPHQGLSGAHNAGATAAKNPLATSPQEVRATLAGFEGAYALLNLSDSSELIRWPKAKIPAEAKIGDGLILEAVSLQKLKEEELTRMRKLLEELIN